MDSRLLRYGESALVLAACAFGLTSACTFPSVDYEDASVMGCSAPASCSGDAQRCGDDARKLFDACSHTCIMKPGCQAMCDSDLALQIGQCNTACQSCSAGQGCTNATSSCKALVGE